MTNKILLVCLSFIAIGVTTSTLTNAQHAHDVDVHNNNVEALAGDVNTRRHLRKSSNGKKPKKTDDNDDENNGSDERHDDNVPDPQEQDDQDHDELYPPNHKEHHDPLGDDDEEYPPDLDGNDDDGDVDRDSEDGEDEPPQPFVHYSQPHEYIDFKADFKLRHDTVLELHDLSKNNNIIYVNNKHYSVDLTKDGFKPMDIYVNEGAEYQLDGVDQDEKLFSSSSSVYHRRQGMDEILVSREIRQNANTGDMEFTGEILTIDVMGEYGGDFHLAKVAPGILATVKPEDVHPDHVEELKSLTMGGLKVPPGVSEDNSSDNDIDNEENNILKKLSPSVATSESRNRRQHRHLSSGCSQFWVEDIAVVFDSTFCAQQGGHAGAKSKLEAVVSKASKIYQRQGVCIKLKISVYEGHCTANFDPYKDALATANIGCSGQDGVLQKFQAYWKANRRTKPRAAAHFFFAKKFDEGFIGCAWIDVLCLKSYGYGTHNMSYSKDTYKLAVLFAHELGHNNALQHVPSSHNVPFIMGSHVQNGENTWASESIELLHAKVPAKGCVTKDTSGSTCADSPSNWHDQDGENYNCAWYAIGANCVDYGSGWKHMGKNAAMACCACGGGDSAFDTSKVHVDEHNDDEEDDEKEVESGITCGCPSTCTSSILGTMIHDKSIEERISWIVDNLNESEEEACELVCGEEFDEICGSACNPSSCK